MVVVLFSLVAATTTHADPAADVTKRLEALTSRATKTPSAVPAFAITGNLTLEHPATWDDATMGLPDVTVADKTKTLVAFVDSTTALITTHLTEYTSCGKPGCTKQAPDGTLRASAVLENIAGTWQPLAWSLTESIPGAQQVEAMDQGVMPDKIARSTTGADQVATLFETTIIEPKAFSSTMSTRKEAVLFGSELTERYVGPAAGKQLAAWSFTFKVRDGLRAGLSKSGNVAWVAANLDGIPTKKLNAKPVPYRAFALYEKTPAGWKLVQLQFSTQV